MGKAKTKPYWNSNQSIEHAFKHQALQSMENALLNKVEHVLGAKHKGSHTHTSTSESKKISKLMIQHNDVESIAWNLTLHPRKHHLNKTGLIKYTQYCNSIMVWDAGAQGVQDMMSIYNLVQLIGSGSVSPDARFALPNNPFALDPNEVTTGGGVIGQVYPSQTYIHLESVSIETEYVNLCTVPMNVRVYWFTSKQNTNRTPSEEWQYQLTQEALGQAASNQSTPSAGRDFYFLPGQSPQALAGFRKVYKLRHFDHFMLQPGSRLHVHSNIAINKTVNEATLRSLVDKPDGSGSVANPPVSVNGLTVYAMLVCEGVAIKLDTGTDPVVSRVTLSSGEIGWVQTQKLKISPVTFNQKVPYTRVYPSIYSKVYAVGDETQINDVDVVADNIRS